VPGKATWERDWSDRLRLDQVLEVVLAVARRSGRRRCARV